MPQNCLNCLVSLQSNFYYHGISANMLHDYISEHLARDRSEYEETKDAMSFEQRMNFQSKIFQLHALLGLLKRVKAHS